MINFLRDLKAGQADNTQLYELFNHPDYDYEFKRYGLTSKENIAEYFMRLNSIGRASIPDFTDERKMC